MSTPLWITSDESAAYEIVRQLIALGVPTQDIRLVQFAPPHDQEKRVGTFDNEDARGQRVGTFDNADAQRRLQGSYDDTQHHQHTQEEPRKGRYDDTDLPSNFPQPQRYPTYQTAAQTLLSAGIATSAIPPETASGYTAIILPADAPYLSEIEQALRHHHDQPHSANQSQ